LHNFSSSTLIKFFPLQPTFASPLPAIPLHYLVPSDQPSTKPSKLSDCKSQALEGGKFAHQAAVQGNLDGVIGSRFRVAGRAVADVPGPTRPPPIGVTVGGNGGDALRFLTV